METVCRAHGSAPDTVIVVCRGEFDSARWQDFRRLLVEQGRADGVRQVVLDLAEVTFFDSSAIRALIGARTELEGHDVALHVDRTSRIVARVFDVVDLWVLFPPNDAPGARDGRTNGA